MTKDSNIALYRQYRPDTFEMLVGQKHIQTILLNALKENQVSHAYLFSGPRGTGKTSTARLIAKGLNCTNPTKDGEPCNKCEICTQISNNQLIDIIEIDAASNRGIDEIRDLREKIKFSPVHAKKKVFIIDEVHMLTKEAFNALLKTLEEPPSHAHLILATTELHKIPATIISRCQHFDFRRITTEDIAERLQYIAKKESISFEDEAIMTIATTADGSLRDAIGLLEQMTLNKKLEADRVAKNLGLVDSQIIEEFINIIFKNSVEEGIKFINDVYAKGIDLTQLVKSTKEALRQRLLDDIDQSKTKDSIFTLRVIKILDDTEKQLKTATIPQLPLELLFVELGFDINQDTNNPVKTSSKQSNTPSAKTLNDNKHKEESTETKSHITDDIEPTNKENPVNDSKPQSDNLSVDTIRQHWGKVIEVIQEATIRMALRKAELTGFENNELTIVLNSKFEYEKINTIKNRNSIQVGLKNIIGQNLTLKLDYDTTELPARENTMKAPSQDNSPSIPPSQDKETKVANSDNSMNNEATSGKPNQPTEKQNDFDSLISQLDATVIND